MKLFVRIGLLSIAFLLGVLFLAAPVGAQDKKGTTIQIDLSKLPPELVKQLLAAQSKGASGKGGQSGQQGENIDGENKGAAPAKGKAAPAPAKGKKEQEGENEGDNDDGDNQQGENKQDDKKQGDNKQEGNKKDNPAEAKKKKKK